MYVYIIYIYIIIFKLIRSFMLLLAYKFYKTFT